MNGNLKSQVTRFASIVEIYRLNLALVLCLIGCGERAIRENSLATQISLCQQGKSSEIVARRENLTDEWMEQIATNCPTLQKLEAFHADLTDTGLQHLSRFRDLRHLRLEQMAVTDRGMQLIANLQSLRVLNLPNAKFGDSGLAAITTLPHLELLRFRSDQVTDAGIDRLRGMPNLRFLHLIGVPMTDRGLKYLHNLKRLESLYVDGGNVSDHAVRDLLEALPNLHFHRDQLHIPGDARQDGH